MRWRTFWYWVSLMLSCITSLWQKYLMPYPKRLVLHFLVTVLAYSIFMQYTLKISLCKTHLGLWVSMVGRSLCLWRCEVDPNIRWWSLCWIWRSWLGHEPDLEANIHFASHAQKPHKNGIQIYYNYSQRKHSWRKVWKHLMVI